MKNLQYIDDGKLDYVLSFDGIGTVTIHEDMLKNIGMDSEEKLKHITPDILITILNGCAEFLEHSKQGK